MSNLKPLMLVSLAVMLTSCKVVNTHVVKLTSTPRIESGVDVELVTTRGIVYLAAQTLSEAGRELLAGMLPYQCVAITTSEQFDMTNREVRFTDFRLKKLMAGDSACRKVRS